MYCSSTVPHWHVIHASGGGCIYALHYGDVIMGTMASQITSPAIVNNRLFRRRSKKHQSPASLAFVWGIRRWPVNSPHKWPVTQKMFPFDDVIMSKLERKWFRLWLVSCSAPSPYLNQCCLTVNRTTGNKVPWNLNKNQLENLIRKLSLIFKAYIYCLGRAISTPQKMMLGGIPPSITVLGVIAAST